MSKEAPTISTKDEIWALLPVDARAEWEAHESLGHAIDSAARNTVVRSVAEMMVKGYDKHHEGARDDFRNALAGFIVNTYGVPSAKLDLVFDRAEELLIEEIRSDGEA